MQTEGHTQNQLKWGIPFLWLCRFREINDACLSKVFLALEGKIHIQIATLAQITFPYQIESKK